MNELPKPGLGPDGSYAVFGARSRQPAVAKMSPFNESVPLNLLELGAPKARVSDSYLIKP